MAGAHEDTKSVSQRDRYMMSLVVVLKLKAINTQLKLDADDLELCSDASRMIVLEKERCSGVSGDITLSTARYPRVSRRRLAVQ